MQPAEERILTVSELTALVKARLEGEFSGVWLTGEVSSLSRPGSGHLYFSLKDGQAVIRSVIWRGVASRLPFRLEDGMQIVARGRISVYAPRGDYQLVLEEIQVKGAGAAEIALRRLKEKLLAAGYFDPARKKRLPRLPKRIVLVTSPTGAAVRDMLEVLGRRWPLAEVWVAPVRVQGEGAPEEISAALQRVNQLPKVDVVLLGRGGGSSEDLAAFNDERVAHALFRMKIPVVSAVGHEIDVTIADLVADRRALTPTEAAEIATPSQQELAEALARHGERLVGLLTARWQAASQRLASLASRRAFAFPMDRIQTAERKLDELEARLQRSAARRVRDAEEKLAGSAARLEAVSPLNVLARGYSLTRTEQGSVVRSADEVQVGQVVEIILSKGRLSARVEKAQS